MYRIYLQRKTAYGNEIDNNSKVFTKSPIAAEAAFRELIGRTDINEPCAVGVLTLNNIILMRHRFDRQPGYADYISTSDKIKLHHKNN